MSVAGNSRLAILKRIGIFRTRIQHELQPVAEAHGLTLPQLRILFDCKEAPDGLTIRQVVETYYMTPGAVSQFVDKLVEKKLVVRKEDAQDRRLTRLHLTFKAKAKLRDIQRMINKRSAVFFETFDAAEMTELARLLDKCISPKQ